MNQEAYIQVCTRLSQLIGLVRTHEDFSTLTSLCLPKAELTPTNHLASEYPPRHLSLMARKILEPRVRNINWIVRTQNKVYLWLR